MPAIGRNQPTARGGRSLAGRPARRGRPADGRRTAAALDILLRHTYRLNCPIDKWADGSDAWSASAAITIPEYRVYLDALRRKTAGQRAEIRSLEAIALPDESV